MTNNLVFNRHKPLAFAPISLIEGAQGAGKTNMAVSEAVDVTFANATSIKLVDGHEFKCSPVLSDSGYPVIGKVKVHLSTKDLVVKCPAGSVVVAEDIRIYANFHFYGIRAGFFTTEADARNRSRPHAENGWPPRPPRAPDHRPGR